MFKLAWTVINDGIINMSNELKTDKHTYAYLVIADLPVLRHDVVVTVKAGGQSIQSTF